MVKDVDKVTVGRGFSLPQYSMMGLLSLVAVVLLLVVAMAPLGSGVAHARGERISTSTLKWTLYTLKDEYIEKIKPLELLKGAAFGAKAYLKRQKLPAYPALEKFPTSTSADTSLEEFQKMLEDIIRKHPSKVKPQDLLYYSLKGLMMYLKDPYSVALEPKEYHHLTESMSGGNFGGAGIYIELDKHHHNQLVVVEPIEESPAARANLKPGDWIMAINGVTTKGIDLDVAAQRIRGPVGSSVRLDLQRKGQKMQVSLTRELIHVKSATGKVMGNVGYIRLRFFGKETGAEVGAALTRLERGGAQAIILDVRNNGGGYIDAAGEVCSLFLPRGQTIVTVQNRKRAPEVIRGSGAMHQPRLPLVVLMNEYSASASEITAGALKDTKRAVLIGTKSFGKGSVQTLKEMPDGGALKFTIAHYLTPSGHDINKKGILPDMLIKMEPAKVGTPQDAQLNKAVAWVREQIAAGGGAR